MVVRFRSPPRNPDRPTSLPRGVEFPTPDGLLELHDLILQRTGGTRGVLQPTTLQAAVERAQWGPFLEGGDLAERGALLLRGICEDHPFADGNKRTAFEATDTFLQRNGWRLQVDTGEVVAFMLEVAQGKKDLADIADWLRRHAGKPLSKRR